MTRIVVVVALALMLAVGTADSESNASGSCPVTIPTETVPPDAGFTASGFNYGNANLRAHLGWPRGTLVAGTMPDGGSWAMINANGSIWTKLGWWRRVPGARLVIDGRRLDAPAPPLRAHVPREGYDGNWTPTSLTFPTVGCWRVVGKVGDARLNFVVKVTKVKRRA